jgi:hypothetical protein
LGKVQLRVEQAPPKRAYILESMSLLFVTVQQRRCDGAFSPPHFGLFFEPFTRQAGLMAALEIGGKLTLRFEVGVS